MPTRKVENETTSHGSSCRDEGGHAREAGSPRNNIVEISAPEPLAQFINELRLTLVNETPWAFGALFVAGKDGGFGLFFADGIPQELRISMLRDLRKTVEAALARYQQ